MIVRGAVGAGLVAFALLDLAVIVAPSVVLAFAAHKGGLPGAHGADLVIASGLIGSAHALIVWFRMWRELRIGHRIANAWIAAFDALVVLALTVTLLLIVVLGGFAPQHAVLINRGWPVLGLWVLVQLAAVAMAELTRSVVLRWLSAPVIEPGPTQTPPTLGRHGAVSAPHGLAPERAARPPQGF